MHNPYKIFETLGPHSSKPRACPVKIRPLLNSKWVCSTKLAGFEKFLSMTVP